MLAKRGHRRQWGLFCGWAGGHQPAGWGRTRRQSGTYAAGRRPLHAALTEEEAYTWIRRNRPGEDRRHGSMLMVVRRAGRWLVIEGGEDDGLRLHLINDARDLGRTENSAYTDTGVLYVDGEVEQFDLSKADEENEDAELLVSYGPGYWMTEAEDAEEAVVVEEDVEEPDYTQCKHKLKYIGMPSLGCASTALLHLDATRLRCI